MGFGLFFGVFLLLGVTAIGWVAFHEMQTSRLQSHLLATYSEKLTYRVDNGPSDSIVFPRQGPYDNRLGYTLLPALTEQLKKAGMVIARQSRFSPELLNYTHRGFHPPYQEKSQAGLTILDTNTDLLYKMAIPGRVYGKFDDIPPVVLNTLLFIEDRELLSNPAPNANPAVDWGRFAKAVLFQAGETIGINLPAMGGSTLATQTEKFRHSAGGITMTPADKLVQMASASVRAYHHGQDTRRFRRQLVLDYLNAVPLSAAPGYGEVNGLGDGMFVWFGTDFSELNTFLSQPDLSSPDLEIQGRMLKQVVSLMIAHRRPSYYLLDGRRELATLTNSYLRLLTREGIVSPALGEAAQTQPLFFRDFKKSPAIANPLRGKGINMVRNRLSSLFDTSLYNLDRFDTTVVSSLHGPFQEAVSDYLTSLQDPEVAKQYGLIGKSLLMPDQTDEVSYSFTLMERTPAGNQVRVQTDTTQLAFDINEGSKLELGSTAKLRTLATYLEIIGELHAELTTYPPLELVKLISKEPDPLTLWVCNQLVRTPGISLDELLHAAMQRTYSANPSERFYTGGGVHLFHNFRREDDHRVATVSESLKDSLNLPFIRIMQDIVRYTVASLWENNRQLLLDDHDPRRKELLNTFIDRESRIFLQRYWQKYSGKSDEQRLSTLLTGLRPTVLKLTIIYRHLYPEASLESYSGFLRQYLPANVPSNKQLASMYEKYAPGSYSLQDLGYLASIHPLELWLLRYLNEPGEKSRQDAIALSEQTRRDVYGWLLRTKAKNARDLRIRTVLEIDAFADIHRRWKNMGYPFDELVPSLATALGSSGDRPAALAELIGIIVNNGRKQPTHRFTSIVFGKDTLYETLLVQPPAVPVQVLRPEVASVLKETMALVVEQGTAKRIANTLRMDDGSPLRLGGKTGTGDNRIVTASSSGRRTSSRALNRTATFVFYLGDNHYGTIIAFVNGTSANEFSFTSALPLQVLKGMMPILQPFLLPPGIPGT